MAEQQQKVEQFKMGKMVKKVKKGQAVSHYIPQ
jgi:hypothetical protein